MQFGHNIRAYAEEMFAFLAEMIAIPSVADPTKAEDGKPYGPMAAKALETILAKAQAMGFSTKNVGNYAGHAEYACGTEGTAAVLAHVDVVPAGSGWDSDPFVLTERDGLLFGRGVLDDKGSAVAALFCMKALKDHGIVGKRSIRCIFGSGEEIGMDDLPHYFAQEPLPELAFTPDSDYGICNREKGILRCSMTYQNDSAVVLSFRAGQVANAVPDLAEAVVRCSEAQAHSLSEVIAQQQEPCKLAFDAASQTATLTMTGKASHAMAPQNGRNAASHLAAVLAAVFGKDALGTLLRFFIEKIGLETDGTQLGVAQSDAPSGALTVNAGILRLEAQGELVTDIRYPVTTESGALIAALQKTCEEGGVLLCVKENLEPLYATEDSVLVRTLQAAYRAVTGEEAQLYATGGGTYARCIPGRCVAFGPVFPGEPDRRMHQCNEHIDKALFLRHAEICLEAMYRLVTAAPES